MMLFQKLRYKYDLIIQKRKNASFERKARKRLKEKNFSILCSNCIGGIIYHRLGQAFLSPTINLWMLQTDFLKFVCNLNHYLSLPLLFEGGGIIL